MHTKSPGLRLVTVFTAGLASAALFAAVSVRAQSGPPAAEDAANKQALGLALSKYEQAIEGGLYGEAADASKLYLNALLQDPNHNPRDRSRALVRLGYAQHHAGEIVAAIENYVLALEALESETNRLDISLAEPMLGLSRALGDAGEYRSAVESYNRLLHLLQVNQGPHTLAQAEAVNELSQIYYRLGNHQRANALQQTYVSIYNQNYPGDNLQQLPALYSRANMQYKTGHMIDSQVSYRRIISMIERADGSQSLYLLPAIYEISDLLQNNRIADGIDGSYKARRYLRRAVHIAENHDDATDLDKADSYIAMGDYLSLQTLDRRAAMRNYLIAWQKLSVDASWADERDARFGRPTLINNVPAHMTPAMRKLIMLSQMELDELSGRLVVRYDVDASGRTHDVELIEGDPTGYWDHIVVDHVDKFIFRPCITDGEATGYPDLVYEIRYSDQD